MKHKLISAFVLLFLVLPAMAQQAGSDAPATKEEVRKLFEVMQVHQQMRSVLDAVVQQQKIMLHQSLKANNPNINETSIAHYDQMMADMVKNMPLDGILDDIVPIYQEHFSGTDIAAMSAFYSSPTGQKMLNEMPSLTAESMQASYTRMQKQMDTMMQRLEQIQKEEQQKMKPTPAAKPKPSQPQN
jgi:uncharacterized protein